LHHVFLSEQIKVMMMMMMMMMMQMTERRSVLALMYRKHAKSLRPER